MSNVETRITLLEDRVKAADNRMIELAMSNNRAYEKASTRQKTLNGLSSLGKNGGKDD